jgi:hypothetical protein
MGRHCYPCELFVATLNALDVLALSETPASCCRASYGRVGASESLDDLVGAGERRGWDSKAERFCGVEVDRKLELGWLLDRYFGRLTAV